VFESTFKLGRIAGIRIGLHYTWFVVFLLLVLTLGMFFRETQEGWSSTTIYLAATASALFFFASIVLHELGHSLVAIARGVPVRSITLFIFGGVAQTEKDADTAATEFWIAIAGPVVSFALAGLFGLVSIVAAGISDAMSVAAGWLARINLVVALFNLVPGFPLDGGRVLRAIVWGVTGDNRKGMRWAAAAGKGVAYGLMLLGALLVMQTGLLLNGLWLAAIGWFLLTAVEASTRAFAVNRLLHGITAREVMEQDLPSVPATLTVADWVDNYVLTTGQRGFLVTDDSRMKGLVTLNDARKVTRTDWGNTLLRAVMTPSSEFKACAPETPVADVLRLMQQYGFNQVPVMVNGEIQGWIDRQRLLQIVQLHEETGR